jgi:hypothetical protein
MNTSVNVSCEYLGDPRFAIMVYRNMLPRELRLIERLEETIGTSTTPPYMWMEALVGHQQKMPEYRDCFDCKVSEQIAISAPAQFSEITRIWSDTNERLIPCLRHYESMYNVKMDYMEAINYVKYGRNQHFQVHTDDGFSYTCTISSVMYLNDDYEGGELIFPHFDLKFKPEAGDIVFFPSNFLFSHASLPVQSGTKYSAVTMFDYDDTFHNKPQSYSPQAATRGVSASQ